MTERRPCLSLSAAALQRSSGPVPPPSVIVYAFFISFLLILQRILFLIARTWSCFDDADISLRLVTVIPVNDCTSMRDFLRLTDDTKI